MRKILLITIWGFCSVVLSAKTTPPNVVLIVVDDLGWSDVGFMGSDYYETPNVDKLASESLVFTNGYAGAANCAPSRAALISGMSSPHTGVYTVSSSTRGNVKTRRLIPEPNTEFLDDDLYTIGDMFQDAGYVTGTFGKWHVGMDPLKQGFDVNVGGSRWGHPKSYFAPYIYPEIDANEGEYLTDRLATEVVQFIEDNKKSPFFVYLPFYTVHTPIQGKEDLLEKYKHKKGSKGHNNPQYAAMVESMDMNIGRVLDKLTACGLDDNTLIVFTSDNGGLYGITEQRPLRAGKGSYFEGGIRVPLTFKLKGVIEPGTTDVPAVNLDFFPTFTEAIGSSTMVPHHLDGTSLWPMLAKGEKLAQRPLVFHFPVYLQGNYGSAKVTHDPLFRCRPGTVLRYGDWKLHRYYEDGGLELYNLAKDPGEQRNLVTQEPEKVKELLVMMDTWIKDKKAPVPTALNPEFDAEFERAKAMQSLNK